MRCKRNPCDVEALQGRISASEGKGGRESRLSADLRSHGKGTRQPARPAERCFQCHRNFANRRRRLVVLRRGFFAGASIRSHPRDEGARLPSPADRRIRTRRRGICEQRPQREFEPSGVAQPCGPSGRAKRSLALSLFDGLLCPKAFSCGSLLRRSKERVETCTALLGFRFEKGGNTNWRATDEA